MLSIKKRIKSSIAEIERYILKSNNSEVNIIYHICHLQMVMHCLSKTILPTLRIEHGDPRIPDEHIGYLTMIFIQWIEIGSS